MSFQLQPEYPIGVNGNSCFFCHSSRRDNEQIVVADTLEDDRLVAFCETCATEVAHMFGLFPQDPAPQKKVLALTTELSNREEEIISLRESLEAVLKTLELVKESISK